MSIANNTLEFWFLARNLWEVPIPTEVNSNVFGLSFKASSAVGDSLILLSFTLWTKTVVGSLSVFPIPGIDVEPIPIAIVVPAPAWV